MWSNVTGAEHRSYLRHVQAFPEGYKDSLAVSFPYTNDICYSGLIRLFMQAGWKQELCYAGSNEGVLVMRFCSTLEL